MVNVVEYFRRSAHKFARNIFFKCGVNTRKQNFEKTQKAHT